MNDLTRLLLFLGQQLYFYKRRKIYIEELKQIFNSETEINTTLDEFFNNGSLTLSANKDSFEITPLFEVSWLKHWDKNVYRVGQAGGGNININPSIKKFTVTVEFDCPLKFIERKIVTYNSQEIILNCIEGFYYEAKSHVAKEEDFQKAEESINRYLSHLSYHMNIPVFIRVMHSASTDISISTKRPEARTGIFIPLPSLPSVNQKQSRALSFFRQFRNFSQMTSTEAHYYQLISLLKIIEGVSPSADLVKNKENFIKLVNKYLAKQEDEIKAKARGVEKKYSNRYGATFSFSEICWEHYRNGVAHWRARGNFLDPDIPDDAIATTIIILERVAKDLIKDEYQVSN